MFLAANRFPLRLNMRYATFLIAAAMYIRFSSATVR
jgi:hypothetical protein